MKQKEPKKRVGIQVFPETMERLRRLRAKTEMETGERLSMDGVINRLLECGDLLAAVKEVRIQNIDKVMRTDNKGDGGYIMSKKEAERLFPSLKEKCNG